MNAIFTLDIYYLAYFFALIFLASFAMPTGALIVIVSFASVASGWQDALILIALSLVATITGDYSAYWTLRILRHKINPMIERVSWMKNKVMVIEKLFNKYASYTVFLTRFLFSGIGPYVNFFSGLQAMPRVKYLKAVILGEMVYCFFFVFIGYFFRETWQVIIIFFQDYMISSIFALFGLYFIYRMVEIIIKNNKNEHKNKTQ